MIETEPQALLAESRHLYIAGTGRSGTSFLVKYLTALGLDTTLARQGDEAGWSDAANAGLEADPRRLFGPEVPYVVKTPWLYLVADQLIEDAADRIDGLIVPVRNLALAAKSRVATERQAIRDANGWEKNFADTIDVWGLIPGGMVNSLSEIDQMRVLAVGFHTLIERFVAADVPIVFLHFPRMVHEADYLFYKLRSLLPSDVTAERAAAAFGEVADPSKVHF